MFAGYDELKSKISDDVSRSGFVSKSLASVMLDAMSDAQKGGPGSGYYAPHVGLPGVHGGSAPRDDAGYAAYVYEKQKYGKKPKEPANEPTDPAALPKQYPPGTPDSISDAADDSDERNDAPEAESAYLPDGRKRYQPTPKQLEKWALGEQRLVEMPTDEWFKERWKKDHHGKVTGWGMGKRDYIVSQMRNTRAYQTGLWQGRLDKARGVTYAEERNENTYNLGYYRGHTDWDVGSQNGMDKVTHDRFMTQVND